MDTSNALAPIDYYEEYFEWLMKNFPNTKDGYIGMFKDGYQFEEFLEQRSNLTK